MPKYITEDFDLKSLKISWDGEISDEENSDEENYIEE